MIIDYFKLTNDAAEIRSIAERLVAEVYVCEKAGNKRLYTPLMLKKMRERIQHYAPDSSPEAQEELLYRFIYDYWAFGCTVDEEYYLNLVNKTAEEKREYMVSQCRGLYVRHLNWAAGPDRVEKLEDKYRLYQTLKPYYKRDVIEVSSLSDMESFASFAEKHSEFVVKPSDFFFGIGVHKVSMAAYGFDYAKALTAILEEGQAIRQKHPSRVSRMVLEELIQQDESLAVLHRNSVNAIRATAVRGKDGKIHLYHPWIKVGINGSFVASAALNGFDAEINPETGIVITDGHQENGTIYVTHPNSGIKIKGYQIPKWDEMCSFVNEIMDALPDYGYIGWDLVLTPTGWCIMEGNYSGEFIFQMIHQRGFRREFEDLIGWKAETEFWWEKSDHFTLIQP